MNMQLTPQTEDYLEYLYAVEVEGATAPTELPNDIVTGELLRRGYVTHEGGTLKLTKDGLHEAEQAVRRHRLAERLLHDVIDIHGQQVDEAACEFEHSLHHGVDDHICTLLGHPKTCPHGRPIPSGRCCRQRKGQATSAITPLSEMKKGEHGTIAYLSSNQAEVVQKLMALGALPGSPVTMLQTFPSLLFQVGQTQIAVDTSLASDIYVRRAGE